MTEEFSPLYCRVIKLRCLMVTLIFATAVIIIISTFKLADFGKTVSSNGKVLLAIDIYEALLITGSIIITSLSVFILTAVKAGSRYETNLLIHQDELERIVKKQAGALLIKTNELESIYKALPDRFLSLSKDGKIRRVLNNKPFSEELDDITGKNIKQILPESHCEQISEALRITSGEDRLSTIECDITVEGEKKHIECRFAPSSGNSIICAIRNITQRKKYEESLKTALVEQEILMREVHHRVKNNLMMIISLINFYDNNDTDNIQIKDLKNRVFSLALVFEQMYQTNMLSRIEISNYIQNLTFNLITAFSVKNVVVDLKVKETFFTPEKAVPLGFIISELLSALFESWPHTDIDEKKLEIEINKSGNEFEVLLSCDIGIKDYSENTCQQSISGRLVSLLVEQLEGRISFSRKKPLSVVLNFSA